VTACTWNPSDIGSGIALSNANLTWTSSSSSHVCGRSTLGWPAGSGSTPANITRYLEATFGTVSDASIGISNTGEPVTDYLGQTSHGTGYYNNGNVAIENLTAETLASYTAPITVGMVMRLFASGDGKLWVTLNGTSFNNDVLANQNPLTNTGGFDFSVYTAGGGILGTPGSFSTVYAAFGSLSSGNVCTANFGATPFSYATLFGHLVQIGGLAWNGTGALTDQYFFAA
jgi:hypothetical protein